MGTMTLPEISEKMRKIDIAMLSTHTENGAIAARPMSNNGEVEYKGDSFYYTWEQSRMAEDIKQNPKVALAFQGDKAFSIAVEGNAELIRDKSELKAHWTSDLDHWFKDGLQTEGIVMIKVHASRIHYWNGQDNGEIKV